ncbi:hypothetical protein D9757_014869 [Collybiopsis confluens]|uniref:Uncharacterized protein n=1 Tax=Collybiopsis confluens TaxID=2823264 RepID=A0A8H5CEG0_9AGAR|nr:hypothetical protein D9757_014869 [Collybiopsis confluens]
MFSLNGLSKAVLSAVLAVTALTVHSTEAASVIPDDVSLPIPTFEPVYDCSFRFPPNLSNAWIDGPLGRRAIFRFEEANFTDSKTGELVAKLIPEAGGGFGINSTVDAKFYVDAIMMIQFVDDHEYAYLKVNGIGGLGPKNGSSMRVQMETGSASRQALAGNFLMFENVFLPANVTPPDESIAYFRLFQKRAIAPLVFRPPGRLLSRAMTELLVYISCRNISLSHNALNVAQ